MGYTFPISHSEFDVTLSPTAQSVTVHNKYQKFMHCYLYPSASHVVEESFVSDQYPLDKEDILALNDYLVKICESLSPLFQQNFDEVRVLFNGKGSRDVSDFQEQQVDKSREYISETPRHTLRRSEPRNYMIQDIMSGRLFEEALVAQKEVAVLKFLSPPELDIEEYVEKILPKHVREEIQDVSCTVQGVDRGFLLQDIKVFFKEGYLDYSGMTLEHQANKGNIAVRMNIPGQESLHVKINYNGSFGYTESHPQKSLQDTILSRIAYAYAEHVLKEFSQLLDSNFEKHMASAEQSIVSIPDPEITLRTGVDEALVGEGMSSEELEISTKKSYTMHKTYVLSYPGKNVMEEFHTLVPDGWKADQAEAQAVKLYADGRILSKVTFNPIRSKEIRNSEHKGLRFPLLPRKH